MTTPSRRRTVKLVRRVAVLLAACVLAVGTIVTAGWLTRLDTSGRFWALGPRLVLAFLVVALLTLVNIALRWVRWHFLTRRVGARLAARESALIYLATLPAILTPFYVGELLRAVLVGKRHPSHRADVAGIWLIERATDLLVVAAFAGVAGGRWTWLLASGLLWSAVVGAMRGVYARRGLWISFRPAVLVVLVALSALAWSLPAIGLWGAVGLLAQPLDFAASLSSFAQATLRGNVAGIPVGTGVTGSTMIAALQVGGIGQDAAILSVLVWRAATAWLAVVVGLVVAVAFRDPLGRLSRSLVAVDHFDEIASDYEEEIPEHVRQRLVARKIRVMRDSLGESGRVLDFGCGQGWYAVEMARSGFHVYGVDLSERQIEKAKANAAVSDADLDLRRTDGSGLPFPDGHFDAAYAINVIHHVTDTAQRETVLSELVRVLKPGGRFFMHEINTANPVFRFYMDYVFPLVRAIDEGTEKWVHPRRLPDVRGAAWQPHVRYFTFLPDFLPGWATPLLLPVEKALERSPLRRWSAHYMAVLRKSGGPGS